MKKFISFVIVICCSLKAFSQVDEEQTGAWYMYFWSTTLKESHFGFQGDVQYRNWNIAGDLEQLLLRGGLTYTPNNTSVKFTIGYANIISGEFGDGNSTTNENRIYQEALLPQKVGARTFITHRFRYEQRFVENQDFRTRYRYNIFMNIVFNKTDLGKGALYLALYNELFINGQKEIGNGNTVQFFDRNRLYGALGYALKDNFRIQTGYMRQRTNNLVKGQIQLSLHHSF